MHELKPGFTPSGGFFLQLTVSQEASEFHTHKMTQQLFGSIPETIVTLSPLRTPVLVNADVPIVRLHGFIVNLPQFWFSGPHSLDFSLEDDLWTFDFRPITETSLAFPSDVQTDAYRLTHQMWVQSAKCETFRLLDTQNALNTLALFLSFCCENWTSPALIVGFDNAGVVVSEEWGTRLVGTLHEPRNWLDLYNGSALKEVFPGFARLANHSGWAEALRSAIYWYVRSDGNVVGPDGAIVLVQSALERLAWHVLVQQRQTLSRSGFKELPTADKIRLLLSTFSIPLELSSHLNELSKLAKEHNWPDGPQAFVEIRNHIVHPPKKNALGGLAFYEALQFGKWCIEMVILSNCGFSGLYANRLKIPRYRGDVERVPWAK